MKRIASLLFVFWSGVIVLAYYAVQKPGLWQAWAGLADTIWTLFVVALLLFNSYGFGKRILQGFKFEAPGSPNHLLLSLGIGLGILSLLGLLFAIIQLANETILTVVQLALTAIFLLRGDLHDLRSDLGTLASHLNLSFSQYSLFTRLALMLSLLFSFLLTLVPPFEAFDALLYHLTLPATILQNAGLQAIDNTPFWFPGLTEHVYLWTLGMQSERAAQLLHLMWALLAALLLWYWAFQTWHGEVARKTLLLLVAIPSLTMLASWAYADMALVFYAIASIYAVTQYRLTESSFWLRLTGLLAGFAMGVKYTSFVVPLACGLILLFDRPLRKSILSAAQFAVLALAVAAPWYLRNAVFMGNPFYPFVFGGRYWDDFLAAWYADAGTGIGWNLPQILLLPFNAVLGRQDITFSDGRIGPLFLVLAPFTAWILWQRTRRGSEEGERWSLITIGVFSLLSFAAWAIGVITSRGLWQARLLLPALIPFTIPTALAWDTLPAWDMSRLRLSSLVNLLVGIAVLLTVVDSGLFVIQRNPLSVAVGAQSRQRYIERINPSYGALMILVDELPAEARLYSVFEPRSYGLSRPVQADPLLYNFPHDVYLFQTSDAIIGQWKANHFTHVLVYERGLGLMKESTKFTPKAQKTLQETLAALTLVAHTPDHVYSIYKIP